MEPERALVSSISALLDRQTVNPIGLLIVQKPTNGTKSRAKLYIIARSLPPPHQLNYQCSIHANLKNRNDTDLGKYTRIFSYKSPQRHFSYLLPELLQNTLRFLFNKAYKHTSIKAPR